MTLWRVQEIIVQVRRNKYLVRLYRLLMFLLCLSMFVFALVLTKEGASAVAPFIRNEFSINSVPSALGFGWLMAQVSLSGSPVAAAALAFLDARVLSPSEAFAMVAGSRLGAAFIVLLVGYVYVLRKKQRDMSLNVGLLSLVVTQTIYPLVLGIGIFLLRSGLLEQLHIRAEGEINSPFEAVVEPIAHWINTWMPAWLVLVSGFLLILFSLWLFDHILPDLHLKESSMGMVADLLYRPMVNFLLGILVTTVTMSVSVSLGLLVPLSVRGYIRRENIIPYILGANITTLVDTLVAAALLANPAAATVVVVQMIAVALVSIFILAVGYKTYERFIKRVVEYIGQSHAHTLIYILFIFLIPFALLFLT